MSVSIVVVIINYCGEEQVPILYILNLSVITPLFCIITMLVITAIRTVCHVQTISMCVMYLHTTLHVPSYRDLLVVAVKLKTREILYVCHVLSRFQVRIKKQNRHI